MRLTPLNLNYQNRQPSFQAIKSVKVSTTDKYNNTRELKPEQLPQSVIDLLKEIKKQNSENLDLNITLEVDERDSRSFAGMDTTATLRIENIKAGLYSLYHAYNFDEYDIRQSKPIIKDELIDPLECSVKKFGLIFLKKVGDAWPGSGIRITDPKDYQKFEEEKQAQRLKEYQEIFED